MTTLDLNAATRRLSDYASELTDAPLVLTQDGKVVAALVKVDQDDLDSLALAENPQFLRLLERSRRSLHEHSGFTSDELRREFADSP